MTGPEHYREAERMLRETESLLAKAAKDVTRLDVTVEMTERGVQLAQVHATLALAAATAYPAISDYLGDEARDGRDWTNVTAPSREPVSS